MLSGIIHRFKLVVAALIVAFSSIASLYLLPPTNANAATPEEIASNVRLYLNYKAILACAYVTDNGADREQITNWQFFDGEDVQVGHVIVAANGRVNCQDTNWVRGVLGELGWTDPFEFLCAAKWQFNGNCPSQAPSGTLLPRNFNGDDQLGDVRTAILQKHAEPALTDADRYYLYSQTFIVGCRADRIGKLSELSPAQREAVGPNNRYIITLVDQTYTPAEYLYQGELGLGERVSQEALKDGNAIFPSCIEVAGESKKYAAAYAQAIKPGVGRPGTCGDRYPSGGSTDAQREENRKLRQACDDGFNNKNNTALCATKYPQRQIETEALYIACIYGQQTATGPSTEVTPPPSEDPNGSGGGGTTLTCAIVAIGWLLCPVVEVASKMVDGAYEIVALLLDVEPILNSGEGAGVYSAWSVMRNFANVSFVIAFLIIIFSQVTSFGVSNYGIKKLLPRLIAAAILVNVSFWLCAIAVDISNILGSSIKTLFDDISNGIPLPNFGGAGSTVSGWAGIAGVVLSTTAIGTFALYAQLTVLLPLLVTVLATILTVLIVLTLRQALIILLIVVSPLAFVAFLLPNTEGTFKKWRQLFQVLLLMYPIIALLFGASGLASKIVMGTAQGNFALFTQMMGAAIAIVPLILLPTIIRTASSVLGKFGAFNLNNGRGPFERLRKNAERVADRGGKRRQIRALNGQGRLPGQGWNARRRARKDAVDAGIDQTLKRAQQQFTANQVQNNPNFANSMAGGTRFNAADPAALQRALAGAKFTIEQAEAEEVKAQHATIDSLNGADLKKIIDSGLAGDKTVPNAKVAAALERLVQIGSPADIQDAVNKYGTAGEGTIVSKTLASAISQHGPGFFKASDLDSIARGRMYETDAAGNELLGADGKPIAKTMQTVAERNISAGVYSQEKLVGASNDELKYASDVANALLSKGDSRARDQLKDKAHQLKNNDVLKGKIKHNSKAIDELASTGIVT